ncbi:MAG: HDIG domain-containing protein [Flavobacteriaceae bacterium]|jgi:cyclic-di-AMP phosphodiesterase PgpH|nr:HDIG domain-containing protein [Flavobacteriaceae bacterium]MDG1793920.1 HDIG domain-containing protein [Flavobacteriaceae bacterium]
MKDIINLFHKNHSLIYKVFLFVITTFVIVYLFPKSGTFRYSFEKGKPWQSENLYAPFDFAIKKTTEEIDSEKQQIKLQSPIFFDVDTAVVVAVKNEYSTVFERLFFELPKDQTKIDLYQKGVMLLDQIYQSGVLQNKYDYSPSQQISILVNKTQSGVKRFDSFFLQTDLKSFVESNVTTLGLDAYRQRYLALFFDLVKPNSQLNKSITQISLEERLSQMKLVRGRVDKQTLIISKGEVVQGDKYAVLKSLVSEYESQVWTDSNYTLVVTAYTVLVSLALLMLLLFMKKYRIEVFSNNTKVTFIFFNIVLMVFLTTLVVNYNSSYIYIVPLCILPLILKAFFDARLGLFTHVITVLLLGFVVANNYEYMFLQIIAGIVTILTVSELYKRANLFISVGQITLIYILSYFAFFVIHEGSIDSLRWETFLLFVLCGLATLFVQPLIYVYEKLFGLVSDVSLLELSDTNSKLLKELSDKAPGTFHHSLNVANLAEAAANEIGANTMLVRVGALYHDIGKMKNPTYFTENQSTGINPHDELSPKESAQLIINHVIEGIELAKKNNLPDRVIDFIRTHHGTSVVYYFHNKQIESNQEFDAADFTYKGPNPFSKETAILMMCDSVEAASKSLKNPTSTKINSFVEAIISKQMESKQFLNANITFKEIESIKKVLKHKLANIYHLRIEYPD